MRHEGTKPQIKTNRFCVFVSLCLVLILFLSHTSANADTAPAKLARDVTIYRDIYGVPHVFGRTDASTAFGFAYAQAEDNFWRAGRG